MSAPSVVNYESHELCDAAKRIELIRKKAELRKIQKSVGEAMDVSQGKADEIQTKLDVFVANLLEYSLRSDIVTMEFPIFSLSNARDMNSCRWVSADNKKWIEVKPSALGRATVHDKDLLIFLLSQLASAMNYSAKMKSEPPASRVLFTVHNFLISTGRDTGKKSYDDFEKTLDRLKGTVFKTNIEIGNIGRKGSFSLISDWQAKTKNGRLQSVEVQLADWLYQAVEKKKILKISDQYFELGKPLEKKLYELARKHVGEQADWSITTENLLLKVGSRSQIGEFRRMVKKIIIADNIPDYRLTLSSNKVIFYQKDPNKLAVALALRGK